MSEYTGRCFVETMGGQGDVLVFVHGLGGTTNTWYPQSQILKRDLRLVGYDLSGSGRSPVPESMTITSHVDDLLAVVTGAASSAKVHLAGHSMGSIICQHFATRHPELVASIVLVGGFQAPPDAAREALRGRAAKVRAEGMCSIADAIVAGGTSEDTRINQPAAAAFVRESIMGQPSEGYAMNCAALAEFAAADLSLIACPVLLLNGDQDKTAPPDAARAMLSQLKNGEAQVLSGCGHWATVERAKQVNYAMTVFYARRRKRQDGPRP